MTEQWPTLEEAASSLQSALEVSVPAWIERSIEQRYEEVHGSVNQAATDLALAAAARVRDEVVPLLGALLSSDMDEQRTTPLAIVRQAVPFATAALQQLGIPTVRRDAFTTERFPEDLYGLGPTSVAELDELSADLAIVWGATKAREHRSRHQNPS